LVYVASPLSELAL